MAPSWMYFYPHLCAMHKGTAPKPDFVAGVKIMEVRDHQHDCEHAVQARKHWNPLVVGRFSLARHSNRDSPKYSQSKFLFLTCSAHMMRQPNFGNELLVSSPGTGKGLHRFRWLRCRLCLLAVAIKPQNRDKTEGAYMLHKSVNGLASDCR